MHEGTHLPFETTQSAKSPTEGIDPFKVWKHNGIWCAIYEAPRLVVGKAYNGYVMIPKGHPWREIDSYENIPVEVHGGLTWGWRPYSKIDVGEWIKGPDGEPLKPFETPERTGESMNWWIGFDTVHGFDMEHVEKDYTDPLWFENQKDRWLHTVDYVIEETERLADQVAAVSSEWNQMELEAEMGAEHDRAEARPE